MSTSSIDISRLPAPQVVESIDFEDQFKQVKTTFLSYYPQAADVLELESEPLTKLLQCLAYQAVVLRQRANDSAVAVSWHTPRNQISTKSRPGSMSLACSFRPATPMLCLPPKTCTSETTTIEHASHSPWRAIPPQGQKVRTCSTA